MKKKCLALFDFLNASPTSWHAIHEAKKKLLNSGFTELKEEDSWLLKKGGKYFVIRKGSLVTFIVPKQHLSTINLLASHVDSPSFKLKPSPEYVKENLVLFGVEPYGAPLLNSWLNRDLGIAGKVIYQDKKGTVKESLVNLENHPVTIPQLAIHLDRQVNEKGVLLNKQEHLNVVAGFNNTKDNSLLERWLKEKISYQKLLSFDLMLYPIEKAQFLSDDNLIASYRIDNLASTHAIIESFAHALALKDTLLMSVFFDHEEVGSHTSLGASSPFLSHVIERITLSLNLQREDYLKLFPKSLCLSIDLAHGYHPGYSDKHDSQHLVLMGKGIVIKHNAQQKYASDAETVSQAVHLCTKNNIPYQHFVSRNDIPCGSTIGPLHATVTGMPTVDIGCPQLSMHACREVMAVDDYLSLEKLTGVFLKKLALLKPFC